MVDMQLSFWVLDLGIFRKFSKVPAIRVDRENPHEDGGEQPHEGGENPPRDGGEGHTEVEEEPTLQCEREKLLLGREKGVYDSCFCYTHK